MRARFLRILAIGTVLVVVLGACAAEDTDQTTSTTVQPDATTATTTADTTATTTGGEPEDTTLLVALSTEIGGLDPHERDEAAVRQVSFNNIFEALFRWSTGRESVIEPSLATDWEWLNPTLMQISIREGVVFHNGEQFDAEAAAFSINRVLDPDLASELAGTLDTVVEARAAGDLTLEIVTTGQDPILLNRLTRIMIVPPGYLAGDSGALRDSPIGTGPYAFVNRTVDGVVLSAFESYWGDTPEFTDVEFLVRLDTAARVAALEAGEVDIIADLPPDAVDQVPNVLEIPSLEVTTVRLNGDGGLTEDIRVREAIAHAINADEIREAFFGDRAVSANGQIVPPGVAGFDPTLTAFEYDLERAQELVEESGIGDQPLRFMVPEGRYPKGREVTEAITGQLIDAGFTVDLQIMQYQDWLAEILSSGPQSFEMSFSATGSENFHNSAQPFSLWVPEDGLAQVMPDEWQAVAEPAYEQALTETDPDKSVALLQEVNKAIHDSYYHVPLYINNYIWGAGEGLTWDLTEDDQIRLATVRSGG